MYYFLLKYFINLLAICFARNKYARKIGIYVYEKSFFNTFKKSIIKFYMESYFDIIFCTFINLAAFIECASIVEFKTFFKKPLDIACSTITIFYAILTIMFPLYGGILIYYNRNRLEKKKINVQLEVYLEGIRLDSLSAAMYNILFLIRRFMTGFVIMIFTDH